jgi:Na+-transporting methylmalonyl-CoA/oxaloacetate decarboxylase gamma subunit
MENPLQFSLLFSVVGIVIVFGALIIISLAVSLIRTANEGWEKREAEEKVKALTKDQSIDNITLILIAAAAATMIQGRFYIRSVRRLLPAKTPGGTWSAQGRAILLGSHVVNKKR